MTPDQTELDFAPVVTDTEVQWFVAALEGKGWTTAAEILRSADRRVTEENKRWVRGLAEASQGQVCGGVRGYSLNLDMSDALFEAWCKTWRTSSEAIDKRVETAVRFRLTRPKEIKT